MGFELIRKHTHKVMNNATTLFHILNQQLGTTSISKKILNIHFFCEFFLVGDRWLEGTEEVELTIEDGLHWRTPFVAFVLIRSDENERHRLLLIRIFCLQHELQRIIVRWSFDECHLVHLYMIFVNVRRLTKLITCTNRFRQYHLINQNHER